MNSQRLLFNRERPSEEAVAILAKLMVIRGIRQRGIFSKQLTLIFDDAAESNQRADLMDISLIS